MGSKGKLRTMIEVGADGVAVITIINPPVNSLSFEVLYGLKESYEQALQSDDVKAIVVTGAKGNFFGGFDITALGGSQGGKTPAPKPGFISVEILTDTFEGAKKPPVAAIDVLALGGGLEVAMACHACISTSNSQLCLPELQLGIIPGFGGMAVYLNAIVMQLIFNFEMGQRLEVIGLSNNNNLKCCYLIVTETTSVLFV